MHPFFKFVSKIAKPFQQPVSNPPQTFRACLPTAPDPIETDPPVAPDAVGFDSDTSGSLPINLDCEDDYSGGATPSKAAANTCDSSADTQAATLLSGTEHGDISLADWLPLDKEWPKRPHLFDPPSPQPPILAIPQPDPADDLVKALLSIRPQVPDELRRGKHHTETLVLAAGSARLGLAISKKVSTVVIHPDLDVVRALNAEPLGSRHALQRSLARADAQTRDELRKYPSRPGVRFLWKPLEQTKLPFRSFNRIVVEQAHRVDLVAVLKEVERLARPGAVVILVGNMPMRVDGSVGDVFDCADSGRIHKLLTKRERQLFENFRSVDFPFDDDPMLEKFEETWSKRLNMEARWDLLQLVAHLDDWPVLKNMNRSNIFEYVQFLHLLAERWRGKRTKRNISWPISVRYGFARFSN